MKTLRVKHFLIFILLIGCNNKESVLSDVLENKAEQSDTICFELETITNFKWDSFFIASPYIDLKRLEKDIGIDLHMLKNTGIEYKDDICLLCFIENNQIIRCLEQERYPVDFANINNFRLYDKKTALFRLIFENDRYMVEECKSSQFIK